MPRNKKGGRSGRKNTPNAGSSTQTQTQATQPEQPLNSASSDIVMGSTEPVTPNIPSNAPAAEASSSTPAKQVPEKNASQSNAAESSKAANSTQPRTKKPKVEEEDKDLPPLEGINGLTARSDIPNATEPSKSTDSTQTPAKKPELDEEDEELPPLEPTNVPAAPSRTSTAAPLIPDSPSDSDSDMSSSAYYGIDDLEYSDLDSDSEDEEEQAFKALARKRTRKYVRAFLDKEKDKHFIDMKIDPLLGRENYLPWVYAIEYQLKMHQVWEVVEDDLCPLRKTDSLYMWYKRMKDVACAVIYANVGDVVRRTGCFIGTIKEGDPTEVFNHLYTHYGHRHEDRPVEEDELD